MRYSVEGTRPSMVIVAEKVPSASISPDLAVWPVKSTSLTVEGVLSTSLLPSLSIARQVTIAAPSIVRSTDTSFPSVLLSTNAVRSSGANPFGLLRDTKRWPMECGDLVLHNEFWQGPKYVASSCRSQIALLVSIPVLSQRLDKTDSGQSTQSTGLPLSSQSAITQL